MYNTEPAKLFDKWVGYSVIAAALRRKVYLQLGRLIYYPNIYVVLVSEPGVARKTQAIKFGVEFLVKIPEVIMSADSSTKEAMTEDIDKAGLNVVMPDGSDFRHSSLNVISKEFESFLGQKKENTRMLTALTDLFDCPDEWSARTKHSGSSKIVRPWVNLLAATTPDSLSNSLPVSAVGGGLTSRIMFIWADRKKRASAIPAMTEAEMKIKDNLEHDLYQISRMLGGYAMTAECTKKWVEWYNNYDEDEHGERICTDKSFSGWYSRKPTYILKIAMLQAASESDNLLLEWRHIENALKDIIEVEYLMGNAFKAMGKSELSGDVDVVLTTIEKAKIISEKVLTNAIWKDVNIDKLDSIIDTCIKMGRVERKYSGPNKEKGIWYFWIPPVKRG
jgi:hypothetical protein